MPRELLYIATKPSSPAPPPRSPIRSVDRILVADGETGPITRQLADEFFGIANGLRPDRYGWLTPVKVNAEHSWVPQVDFETVFLVHTVVQPGIMKLK
jgi:branched-chain amino acid aminotransferase